MFSQYEPIKSRTTAKVRLNLAATKSKKSVRIIHKYSPPVFRSLKLGVRVIHTQLRYILNYNPPLPKSLTYLLILPGLLVVTKQYMVHSISFQTFLYRPLKLL